MGQHKYNPKAIAALYAYADATENKVLAYDIRKWLDTIIPAEEEEVCQQSE